MESAGNVKKSVGAAANTDKSCKRQLSFQPGNISRCRFYLPLLQINCAITTKLTITCGKSAMNTVSAQCCVKSGMVHRSGSRNNLPYADISVSIFILLKFFQLLLHELFCDLVLEITLSLYQVPLCLICFHCS